MEVDNINPSQLKVLKFFNKKRIREKKDGISDDRLDEVFHRKEFSDRLNSIIQTLAEENLITRSNNPEERIPYYTISEKGKEFLDSYKSYQKKSFHRSFSIPIAASIITSIITACITAYMTARK